MKVRINLATLNSGDESTFSDLDELAQLCETGRHVWHIDPSDIQDVERSAWLLSEQESRRGRRNWDLFRKSAKLAVEIGNATLVAVDTDSPPAAVHQLEVFVGENASFEVAPKIAIQRLSKAAALFVEDDRCDGNFVKFMIRTYKRDELGIAVAEKWLEFVNSGGSGGVKPRVKRMLALPDSDPSRIAALFDSDRLFPEHESDTVRAATKLGAETGIYVKILFKREAENYLPLVALGELDLPAKVKVFRDDMSVEQRNHFDMKEGFGSGKGNGGRVRVSRPQQGLFAGLGNEKLELLVGGFGKKCGNKFENLTAHKDEVESQWGQGAAGTELLDFLLSLEAIL